MSEHKYSWQNFSGNESLYPKHFDRVYLLRNGVWRHGVVEYHSGAFLQVHDAQSGISFREFDEWMPADEFNRAIADHNRIDTGTHVWFDWKQWVVIESRRHSDGCNAHTLRHENGLKSMTAYWVPENQLSLVKETAKI